MADDFELDRRKGRSTRYTINSPSRYNHTCGLADHIDHQVPPAIRSPGHLYRIHGLRPQADRRGRRRGALEGLWTGDGQGVPC
jgi:hypothetical protein